MALQLPAGEGGIASYTWTDMIAGLGYKRFYGGADMHAGIACTYYLTSSQPDSPTCDDGETRYYGSRTYDLTSLDLDFDMTFNVPAIVMAAPAFVSFAHGIVHSNTLTTVVTIYHVRGATETSLGTATTFAKADSDDTTHNYREMLIINLTRQKFKAGDKLRISFAVGTGDGANHGVNLKHDPEDATFTDNQGETKGSALFVDIPFKIDL